MNKTVGSMLSRARKLPIPLFAAVIVMIGFSLALPNAAQAQSEATLQAIVATFTDYFNDVPAYQSMTTEQKADYILNQGRNRIVGRALDLAKSNLATYSEEVLRHKLMMKYINDYAAQQVFMTMVLEGEAAAKSMQAKLLLQGSQQVNQQIVALNLGVNLGVGAITGYLDNGLSGAFWGTTQAAGEWYTETVIPFYGWAKLVVQIEAALINYFKGYVKEQQVECALNQIYGSGLMGQLASKSRADVDRSFEDAWARDDGVADVTCGRYGYGAEGMTDPATGKPYASFKNDVKLALMNMKDALDQKIQQAQTATKSIIAEESSKVEGQVKAAEANLKAAYESALSPVKPLLAKIDELRQAVPQVAKAKAVETKAKVEQAQSQTPSGGISCQPLNRSAILNAMNLMLAEIKDTPGTGYNYDTYLKFYSEYNSVRANTIKAANQKIQDDYTTCARQNPSDNRPCINNCNQKLGNDVAILQQEEKILKAEAQERGAKATAKLAEIASKTAQQLNDANNAFKQAETAFRLELQEKLGDSLRNIWVGRFQLNPQVMFGAGYSGIVEEIKAGTYQPYAPGALSGAYKAAEAAKERVQRLQPLIPELYEKEKKVYTDFETALNLLKNQFEANVAASLRGMSSSGTGQWTLTPGGFSDYIKPPGGYVELPAPALSPGSMKYELDRLQKPPFDLKESLAYIESALDVMRSDTILDDLAVTIVRMAPTLASELGAYKYRGESRASVQYQFHQKGGNQAYDVPPDQTDGAAYLGAMKAAWEKGRPTVEKFQSWKKTYGKGLKYMNGDPAPFLAEVDAAYATIPEKIKVYELAMATEVTDRQTFINTANEDLKKLQQQFEECKTKGIVVQLDTPKRIILPTLGYIIQAINMGSPGHVLMKDKVFAFKAEVEAFVAQKEKEWAEIDAEQKRVQEEQRKYQIMIPEGGTDLEKMTAYAIATGLLSPATPAQTPGPGGTAAATAPAQTSPTQPVSTVQLPAATPTPATAASGQPGAIPTPTVPSSAQPVTTPTATTTPPSPQPTTTVPAVTAPVPTPQTHPVTVPTTTAPQAVQPAPAAPPASVQPAAAPTPQPVTAETPKEPAAVIAQPALQPSAAIPASPPKPVQIAEQVSPPTTLTAVDKPASPPPVEPKPDPTPVVTQTPPEPVVPEVKETVKSPEPPAPAKPEPVETAPTPEAPPPPPKVTETVKPLEKTPLSQVPAKPAGKPKDDPTPKIKTLYDNLKKGYGSRNLLGFAQCIAPDWQGTDGMTYASLWKNLMQTFKDYNDLHCTIQNLSIEKTAEDRYKTTYDITLSGTLRKTKEKKQEQSTVTEEVRVDKSGRPKIVKTTAGRFWLGK